MSGLQGSVKLLRCVLEALCNNVVTVRSGLKPLRDAFSGQRC